ncbi:host-nuclease inhibitor Gam family protein [Patescibacteria group bacterium]|nr:host-nuclease inhibitor Gam family protein [Patescibacteria group bacterium]MBU2218924.1 host-nuclease inhibitor Gam family protein [Patescibacteria group bacterium]MBU2263267.1 host-nuclease inhibitor Gam family protein [Patescibacteria group bacterium]
MLKKVVIAVPKSLDEAAEFLAQMGKEQRATDVIQSGLNAEVDRLKAKAMAGAKPHQDKISQLVEGLFAFAEAHRDELTDHGKRKTVEVPTGTFGWRMTPLSVSLRDAESILKSLRSLGLQRFIRIKEEVSKEAMLKEPDVAKTVKGVSISQREEFVAKPAELEVEIATQVDKLKKAAS